MTDFSQARQNMVDCQIRPNGVVDQSLFDIFSTTPRELFIPEKMQGVAYTDESLDIGQGRYLLSPMIHAKMLQAVLPNSDDITLDIGCGYGYSSAILSPLVSTVIACEKNKRQSDKALRLWEKLGACNVVLAEDTGDLLQGVAKYAPYSLIMLNGAVKDVPQEILDQLANGGRLITIIRKNQKSQAVIYRKDDSGHVSSVPLFDAYAPLFTELDSSTVQFQF